MTDNLYLVGGHQKSHAHRTEGEHQLYEHALILALDCDAGTTTTCATYRSPPEVRPDQEPSIVFKAGTLVDDVLHVCTQTELLAYSVPEFELVRHVSLPCFNDVHHVRPAPDGTLLVANTGLDMVVRCSPEGELLNTWNVMGEDPWHRFDPSTDYRKVATTKPHDSHPNFVFHLGDEVWVTRFKQRDAVSLSDPDRRIDIEVEKPHDGLVRDGSIYFTTVDGHILEADADSLEIERCIDLNSFHDEDRALGWCRGLWILGTDRMLVGFSRIRPTRFRQNLSWMKEKIGLDSNAQLPTRVVLYDLAAGRVVWERVLETEGMDALFSIHPANGGRG